MRDLDMSDVFDDAANAESRFMDSVLIEMDRLSDDQLRETRYKLGIAARRPVPDQYALRVIIGVDRILLSRTVTAICECCFGRTGCDMCQPYEFTDWGTIDQDAHFEKFGYPAFPNEY